jgi:hypothetical protein
VLPLERIGPFLNELFQRAERTSGANPLSVAANVRNR